MTLRCAGNSKCCRRCGPKDDLIRCKLGPFGPSKARAGRDSLIQRGGVSGGFKKNMFSLGCAKGHLATSLKNNLGQCQKGGFKGIA